MIKSSLLPRLITAAIITSLAMVACKKEQSAVLSPAEEEQIANYSGQSETENEVVFNDVFDNVMGVNTEVGIGGTGIFGRLATNGRETGVDSLPSCTIVTISLLNAPARFPMKIVIDFGTGCVGKDGHKRSGKIITEYSGRLIEPGSSATTRFENYYFDSIAIQGTHKITNTTAAGSNQRQFTIDITDGKITKPNGDYSVRSSQRVVTQVEGNGTPQLPQDDIFKITGSEHGKIQRGNLLFTWQSEIIEPLVKKFTCRWISQGTIRLKRETLPDNSKWVATLNYGQGVCDYYATLTVNGQSHDVLLPH
ncbi:MAG: hypothetical protein ACXVLT_03585 [Flavisolibacter sp.]